MQPKVNFPAAQIVNSASTAQLSTSSSAAVAIPTTSAGFKPAFIRISVSAGAVYVNAGASTSVTSTTGDTIVTSNEALWLNTVGFGAVSFLQTAPGGVAFGNVSACEEGGLQPYAGTGPAGQG